eukprot:6472018-Amphidinium_carterae.1
MATPLQWLHRYTMLCGSSNNVPIAIAAIAKVSRVFANHNAHNGNVDYSVDNKSCQYSGRVSNESCQCYSNSGKENVAQLPLPFRQGSRGAQYVLT